MRTLGAVDAMKFRSRLALFAEAARNEPCFHQAPGLFYGGTRNPATPQLLGRSGHAGLER